MNTARASRLSSAFSASWPGASRNALVGIALATGLPTVQAHATAARGRADGSPSTAATGANSADASKESDKDATSTPSTASDADRRVIRVPGTTVSLELRRVPLGGVPDGTDGTDGTDGPSGTDEAGAPALFVGTTEITWDLYDVFVYRLDEPEGGTGGTGDDAIARPSKPYVPPDRGFGHAGFPAMGMTQEAAKKFCLWLGARTGERFRLPTEAEWERFALAGDPGQFACEAEPACLLESAWFVENSDGTTKAAGVKAPNRWGLFDVHGNVAEWVLTDDGRRPIAKGGSYLDSADHCAVDHSARQQSAWSASDPQVPKSAWWLADCSFVGFRVVLEPSDAASPAKAEPAATPSTPATVPARPDAS